MGKKEIVWDLSGIFSSTTDPSIQKALDDVTRMAEDFESRYKTRLESLSPEELLKCFQYYENYLAKRRDITLFAGLSFVAHMTLPDTQSLYDRVMKADTELDKKLAFFKIEAGNLVKKKPELVSNRKLTTYKHFLEKLRRKVPHQLSEVEEQLILEKDMYGVAAWEELQAKWLSTRVFKVRIKGKMKSLSFGEATGLLSKPDRSARKSAITSIYIVLGKDGEIFSSALRNVCNDWLNVCERRKFASPNDASLISNDVSQQTVENLLEVIAESVGLYQRYMRLKAKAMQLPKLECHDISAPIPDAPRMRFEYDRTKDLIIKAYSRFDANYAFAVKDMFAKKHIDPLPRLGKQNGAFASSWYNGKSAFVLANFNETLNDVYTLAHELGHATHFYYFLQDQTYLNSGEGLSMAVAETASVFGELLLTDLMLSQAKSRKEKKAIICTVLDNAGIMIFWATAAAWFEQSLYDSIKHKDYLDYKTVCKLWIAARDKLYGDTVQWFSELEAEWAPIPHFYMPNFRFYNYPYAYAQLFVYALYQKYLEEGKGFVPKFKKALSAGCSISPVEIGKIVGLDVTDPHFWELGLKQYEHFVEELEKVVS